MGNLYGSLARKRCSTASLRKACQQNGDNMHRKLSKRQHSKKKKDAVVDKAARLYSDLEAWTSAAGKGRRRKCCVVRTIFALPGNQGFLLSLSKALLWSCGFYRQ